MCLQYFRELIIWNMMRRAVRWPLKVQSGLNKLNLASFKPRPSNFRIQYSSLVNRSLGYSFQDHIHAKMLSPVNIDCRQFSSRSDTGSDNRNFFADKSPYEVLGVSKSSTEKEIKLAYFKMAKKHHPDVNPTDKEGAKQRFMIVSAAYVISED